MTQTPDDPTTQAQREAVSEPPQATSTLASPPSEERERGGELILEEFGSLEEFEQAMEATIKEFDDGSIVEGVIVKVDPEECLLDIGYKSEGVIPSRELSIKHDVDPHEVVSVGDVVEALVLQKEDKDGRLVLSKKRAQYERAWGKIEEIYHNDSTVTGTVIEVVKGGLIIDIGLRGFLPASLVEMRRVRDLHPFVGRELECKVIELDKNRNNVVLSRRKFLEETQSEFRREFLETLQKGEVRKGTVSSIVNFGAFVDLGGVDGLVHVSELSWKHIDHPGEVVEVGQEVEVEVLDVDLDRERVSLSLKATQEDPWRQFARQHYVGEFVEGHVTKLVPFGAFVKVDEGIEGLVHISELAEAHVEVPEQVVKVDDPVTVKIIDIDEARRRISLSLKQAVKAGYGAEPEIAEEPDYAGEAEPEEADTTTSGAMGAALEAALQQRSEAQEAAAEPASEPEEPEAEEQEAGGVTLEDVVAQLKGRGSEAEAEQTAETEDAARDIVGESGPDPAEPTVDEAAPGPVETGGREPVTQDPATPPAQDFPAPEPPGVGAQEPQAEGAPEAQSEGAPEEPRSEGTEEPRSEGTEEPRSEGTEEPGSEGTEEPQPADEADRTGEDHETG